MSMATLPDLKKAIRVAFLCAANAMCAWAVAADSNSTTSTPMVAPATHTWYVDLKTGNDADDGSRAHPWQDIQKATEAIKPGDTVIIADGVYRLPNRHLAFKPGGIDASHPTIFKAAPNARVIVTGPEDAPADIEIGTARQGDYIRVEGLWFGGKRLEFLVDMVQQGIKQRDPNDACVKVGGTPIGKGKQVINCTIFNTKNGLITGSTEDLLIQGCRFVMTGQGGHFHGVYLSGADNKGEGQSNHLIVDNNIFVGGEGYAIHGYHMLRNMICTRNFVAGHRWGLVLDGSEHLVANNFFWKFKGLASGQGEPWGPMFGGWHNVILNNIFGPNAKFAGGRMTPDNVIVNNAYVGMDRTRWLTDKDGNFPTQLTVEDIGISEQEIDTAIDGLRNAFAQSMDALHDDKSVEANFARLRFTIPKTSPFYRNGKPWFEDRRINIGPNADAPTDTKGFWDAFHALGLKDYNRFGEIVASHTD